MPNSAIQHRVSISNNMGRFIYKKSTNVSLNLRKTNLLIFLLVISTLIPSYRMCNNIDNVNYDQTTFTRTSVQTNCNTNDSNNDITLHPNYNTRLTSNKQHNHYMKMTQVLLKVYLLPGLFIRMILHQLVDMILYMHHNQKKIQIYLIDFY